MAEHAAPGKGSRNNCNARVLERLPQFIYLSLLFSSFYLYSQQIFAFLPQPYVPLWHQWTAAFLIGAALLSFAAVKYSNPGIITKANYAKHCQEDAVTSRHCWTCDWARLSHSKHCSLCNRCISQHDHHCYVVDNCIGQTNAGVFLIFIAVNLLLCLYGVILGALILEGLLRRYGALDTVRVDYSTGELYMLKDKKLACFLWLVTRLPKQVALLLMMLTCCLAAIFFLLHYGSRMLRRPRYTVLPRGERLD